MQLWHVQSFVLVPLSAARRRWRRGSSGKVLQNERADKLDNLQRWKLLIAFQRFVLKPAWMLEWVKYKDFCEILPLVFITSNVSFWTRSL